MAPEITGGKKYEGPPVDIFALGAVLFMMKTAKFAFTKYGDQLYKRFQANPQDALVERNIPIEDPDFTDLVAQMTKKDPNHRLTLDEIIDHPYM
jgi:serine/threonine protein kinase